MQKSSWIIRILVDPNQIGQDPTNLKVISIGPLDSSHFRLEASPGSSVYPGDVILANHTSYIDVIYLAFRFDLQTQKQIRLILVRFAPVFTALPNTWDDSVPEGVAIQRSFFGALIDAITEPEYTSK